MNPEQLFASEAALRKAAKDYGLVDSNTNREALRRAALAYSNIVTRFARTR